MFPLAEPILGTVAALLFFFSLLKSQVSLCYTITP